MEQFSAGGRLWKTTTFSKPLTICEEGTLRTKNGIAEVVDKDGNVIDCCTYEVEIHDP